MLKTLVIKNIALIPHLELEFGTGLNVLSGETGAGKSIIVDGLMLLMGGKYDKTLLRYGEESGLVEGVFDCPEEGLLKEYGYDEDDTIVVSRKFYIDGKNEIRINGRSATASMLRSLTASLVDIYGQNEYQSLSKPSRHLGILDYYVRGSISDDLTRLKDEVSKYKAMVSKAESIGDIKQRERNIDMYRFQIEEIESAKIYDGEEDEIVSKRKIMLASERIISSLGQVVALLSENESGSADSILIDAVKNAAQIASLSSAYEDLHLRLESVLREVSDISGTAADELSAINFDASDLDNAEKRLDNIRQLKRKYGEYSDMQKFLVETKENLSILENSTEIYEKLLTDIEKAKDNIYKLSLNISQQRKKGAKLLEDRVKKELSELGMENSSFQIVFSDFPDRELCGAYISAGGMDTAEFYLSPNAGQPIKPLAKIISGGEMSRFMLALKTISSETDNIPTMIFDEIDTGISGIIGQEIAKKLARISSAHQVLCVTHLSQIASMADSHFYITKNTENGVTNTSVKTLYGEAVLHEISRLSGSHNISGQSILNAAEMKKWSEDYKNSL